MTLIECFVNSPLENIATALCLRPEKIIFIGNAKNTNLIVDKYRSILKKPQPDIIFKKTASGSFISAEKKIREVLLTEKDCVLDITGGQEAVLMAAGALYSEFKNINPFKIFRFDADSSLMADAVTGHKNIGTKAALSVDELISLHGGKVTSAQADIPDEASKHDINMLWQEVSANPEIWNKTISNLHEFQNKSGNDKKTNSYYLDFNEIAEKTVDFEEKSKRVAQLLRNLAKTEI